MFLIYADHRLSPRRLVKITPTLLAEEETVGAVVQPILQHIHRMVAIITVAACVRMLLMRVVMKGRSIVIFHFYLLAETE